MKRVALLILSLFSALMFFGCGGGGGATGTVSVSMTDATLPNFQAIYITVDAVEVRPASDGNWLTVADPKKTVNLLELINGVREELGVATLATGHYTQMRLILGREPEVNGLNLFSRLHPYANYFIDENGMIEELKVPSGLQTGIKIVNGFDINENQTTELILDFDAAKSVVMAGSSGKWLLKPTVKVLRTETYAVFSGTVTDNSSNLLEGVYVSAQVYNVTAGDDKDVVTVQAATLTDANGDYVLFLEPGDYNLVAFLGGESTAYGPDCTAVTASSNIATVQDFDLLPSTDQIGTIEATVTIPDPDAFQHATVSIRQGASCNGGTDQIEVDAFNIAAGGTWNFHLPADTYDAVGWTFGRDTQVAAGVVVTNGGTAVVGLVFPLP